MMDLSTLNDAQREAVTSPGGAHLVIAGAGTGKTRTLVHRVAWLLEQGEAPDDVALLTFTRRAAAEMLHRVADLVGPRARGVQGGTFHSFGHLILRRHARRLGYTPSFTLLDRADAESLIGMVRAELGFTSTDKRFPRRGTITDVLSKAVNTGRDVQTLLERDYPQYVDEAEAIERIGARYAERKRAQDLVDYDDLLTLTARLLRDDPDARAEIASGCRHVLVDEYQDTNRVQALIACLLASAHGNLMVVGDEAQSIYAFRGAVVDNILDFPMLFDDTRVTRLETSYRSTPEILDLANGLLATAARGYDKTLRAVVPPGGRPQLVRVEDEHAQADLIVRAALDRREEGVDLGRQAVLFRSTAHAHLLEVALTQANIPFRKYGGLRFSEAAHIKDALSLLRIVANPRDQLSWFRVLGWCEGLGPKTAEALSASIAAADPPALRPDEHRKRRYHADLVDLARLLDDAARLLPDPLPVVETCVAWYRDRMPRLYEDYRRRLKDLDSLPLLADRATTLEAMLSDLALDPVEEAERGDEVRDDEILTLSTVHSAKGLEWDTVYVLQLVDGAFPSGPALADADELEEEKRLLYVAVTRARRRLVLVQPWFTASRGGRGWTTP
ncbi:MAG TPA: ATP-dependent helicase, partial [Myxococcota bacterium]|nr:ATP-dependent helicase [Myxococcota bacterium]